MARIAFVVFFVVVAISLVDCLPVKTANVLEDGDNNSVDQIVEKNDLTVIVPSDKHVIVKRSPSVGLFHGERCPIGYFRAPNRQCLPEHNESIPEPEEEDEENEE